MRPSLLSHNRKAFLKAVLLLLLWTISTASSCTSQLRNEQLEQVAKDWALVIRASQVIPVYPLSEDLQPGDVLLVSTPIENQVALYKEKGFLPLDQLLIRLYSKDFKDFYNSRYGITGDAIPPAQWQLPTDQGNHSWKLAPRAAFPTYQFAASRGSGLNLAIPIHGIPFALALMNSGKASGSVTISDAFTFGLDNAHLTKLVQEWGGGNRPLLSRYAPYDKQSHFLRVISRVYVAGEVSVTINNDEVMSGQASGGADQPVELLGITKGAPDTNYSAAIDKINDFASTKLPGGKLKIATSSSRSVTLKEAFERPLVIGYVGFDMQILDGGRLGPPISTLTQLTNGASIPSRTVDNTYRFASLSHMYQALKEDKGSDAALILRDLNKLGSLLPDKYPFSLYEVGNTPEPYPYPHPSVRTGATVNRATFSDVVEYLGYGLKTTKTLERYLSGTSREIEEAQKLEHELGAAKDALADISSKLSREPALMRAVDFVFLGI